MILAVSYALMSYVVVFSEILMWFDGLIYLPLVILGINRLLEKRKPTLLFISYFLLFISNYYITFRVGIFSFFYTLVRIAMNRKQYLRNFPMYLKTSFFAGGASMVMILPVVLGLRNNGESLSDLSRFFTKATGPWGLLIKNMVGFTIRQNMVQFPLFLLVCSPLFFVFFIL